MLYPSPKMAAPMAVRVALVEDNPTFRRRFLERFRFFEDVEVVLAAGSGEEFLDRLDALPEDARLRIPLRAGNRSLNLSNAAAVALYEAWRQLGFPGGR